MVGLRKRVEKCRSDAGTVAKVSAVATSAEF